MSAAVAQSPRSLLLNFASFQAGWFACVLGAAHGLPWLGPLVTALILAGTVWQAPRRRALLLLLALAGAVGLCWDSALAVAGLIAYPAGLITPPFAPPWILALWLLLATTLNRSLRWLQGSPWLAAALGAVSAPLSYLAGARLGALLLLRPQAALIAQAVGWALLLPVLSSLARRLDA